MVEKGDNYMVMLADSYRIFSPAVFSMLTVNIDLMTYKFFL